MTRKTIAYILLLRVYDQEIIHLKAERIVTESDGSGTAPRGVFFLNGEDTGSLTDEYVTTKVINAVGRERFRSWLAVEKLQKSQKQKR